MTFWQPLFAFTAALLPGAVFIVLLLQLGKRRFAAELLSASITLGAISGLVPFYTGVLTRAFEKAGTLHGSPAASAFLAAGCLEEAVKSFVIYVLIRPHYLRRSGQDLVLAGAGVGLGFALFENIFYVVGSGAAWEGSALVRAALTVPMHAMLGLLLGYGVLRCMPGQTRTRGGLWILGTWLVAACLHGLYDYPLLAMKIAPFYAPVILRAAALLQASPAVFLQGSVTITLITIVVLARIVLERTSLSHAEPDGTTRDVPSRGGFLEDLIFERSAFWLSIATGILGLSCAFLAFALIWRGAESRVALELLTLAVFPLFTAALFTWTTPDSSCNTWMESLTPFAPKLAPLAVAVALTCIVFSLTPTFDGPTAKLQVESGLERMRSGSSREALGDFDDVLLRDPHNEAALFSRAMTHSFRNEDELSLADARELRALRPDDAQMVALEAQILSKLRRLPEAQETMDSALTARPNDASLLDARAEVAVSAGDTSAGRDYFTRALQNRPEDIDALTGLADIDFQSGDRTTAQGELDRALRKSPGYGPALFLRGRVRFFMHRYQDAVTDFRQAVLAGDGPYAALWLFLAESSAGQDGRNELAFWATRTSRDVWPFPIFELFLGARSVPMVQATAKDDNARCELEFYLGEWMRLQHFDQQGVSLLQSAERSCPVSFVEREAATMELRSLAPPSATPASTMVPLALAPASTMAPPVNSVESAGPSLLRGADKQYTAVTTWTTNKARPDVGITPAFSSTTKFLDARRTVVLGIRQLLYPGNNDEFLVTIAASLMPNSRESQFDPLNGLAVNGRPSIVVGDRRHAWPTMKVAAQEQSISYEALERLLNELDTAAAVDIPLRSKTGATLVATIRLTPEARTALAAFRRSLNETSVQVAEMRKAADQNAN